MTTTPTASPELPDLDRLEALADSVPEHLQLKGWYVAPPSFGHQHVYADNFKGQGRQHIASLPAHKTYFAGLAEFIAAFDPATVKQLVALARRAKPEGEANTSDVARLLALASEEYSDAGASVQHGEDSAEAPEWARLVVKVFAQPEGEAPQAVAWRYREWFSDEEDHSKVWKATTDPVLADILKARNAIIEPLVSPAAQHAESGATVSERAKFDACFARADRPGAAIIAEAERAAQSQGARCTYCDGTGMVHRADGEYLGECDCEAAQQAAAPGALDADELTRLRRLMRALGNADAFERDDSCVRGILCTVLGEAASRIERAQQAAAPGAKQWTDKEIADACVQAGLGILECNALLVTLKASPPGTPEAPVEYIVSDGLATALPDVPAEHPKGDSLWQATMRACGELPEGYEVRIELEKGCGMAVWYDDEGERHVIDGDGYLSDDVNEAVDAAIQRAAQLDGGQEGSAK